MSKEREILGVSPTATVKEIRARYRELARTLHPDVGGDSARFAEITTAFKRLIVLLPPNDLCMPCGGKGHVVIGYNLKVSCPRCWGKGVEE